MPVSYIRHASRFLAAGLMLSLGYILDCVAPAMAAKPEIGVAAAVRPAATGTPPGLEERILHVGLDVVANERIETKRSGQTHLLFRDGSTLTIGPNSSLILDTFVFDAQTRTGELIVSASKGLFRFVGGRISKTRPVLIKTPSSVIGIRGGVALVRIGEEGQSGGVPTSVSVTMLYGDEVTMTAGGSTKRMTRPGSTIVQRFDGAIEDPQPASQAELNGMLSEFEDPAAPDEDGEQTAEQLGQIAPAAGGPSVSDEDVSESQLSSLGSENEPNSVTPTNDDLSVTVPDTNEAGDEVRNSALLQALAAAAAGEGNGNSPPSIVSSSVTVSGRAKHASSSAGGDDAVAAFNRGFNGILLHRSDGSGNLAAPFDNSPNLLLPIAAGVGNPFGSTDFTIFPVNNASPQPFGPSSLSGLGALSENRDFVIYQLVDNADGHRVLVWAGVPTPTATLPTTGVSQYGLTGDYLRNSDVAFAGNVLEAVGNTDQALVGIAWDRPTANAQRAFGGGRIRIRGTGNNQQTTGYALFGRVVGDGEGRPHIQANSVGISSTNPLADSSIFFSGGVASSDDSNGNDFFGSNGPAYFTLEAATVNQNDVVQSRGTTRIEPGISSTFYPSPVAYHRGTSTSVNRTTRTINGFTTGIARRVDGTGVPGLFSANTNPTSFGITTNANLNTISMPSSYTFTVEFEAGNPGPPVGTSQAISIFMTRFGESTPSGRSAFIHDGSFFATDSNDNGTDSGTDTLFLATHDILDTIDVLPSGVGFCQCEYVQWGFWGGAMNGPSNNLFGIELATWVAGDLSSAAQVTGSAATNTANFSGHVFAHLLNDFNNASSAFHAVGRIDIGVTFEPGHYTVNSVTISNLDNTTYTSAVNSAPTFTSNQYNANHLTITGNHPVHGGVRAFIDSGAFFGPGTPPRETAGGIRINSANLQTYKGVGTYAARNLSP